MSTEALPVALPRCVALRSKHDKSCYLRSVHDESRGGSVVELGVGDNGDGDGNGVMNPRCKFFLEPSKEHEGLVHVRCAYNNKYWVPQQRELGGGGAHWVVGTADEPEEDLSKQSCTLHKPILVAAGKKEEEEEKEEEGGFTCSFLHSQLGKYTCVSPTSGLGVRPYLHVVAKEDAPAAGEDNGGSDSHSNNLTADAFTLIDVSAQKQLPSYIALKGNNGSFLGARVIEGYNYLQFSEQDVGDARVMHTVFTNEDGVVRIKSNYFGLYWRRSPNWIWADSNDNTHRNRDTLFRVVTGDDFIALRNLGNNNFCKRLTTEGKTSCLNAAVSSITPEARMECHEPVLSREIYDVDFRLSEARKYTTGIDGLHSQTVKNRTSTTNTTTLTFTYTTTVESTWSSTVSVKTEIKTKLKTGVPFVAEGEIEVSTEFSGSYTWGKTQSETKQTSKHISVQVPPMKKVTVRAIGTNGVCDVPFSYTQRDVLFNGKEVTQKFTDGMYFGVKTSDVTFETTEENL